MKHLQPKLAAPLLDLLFGNQAVEYWCWRCLPPFMIDLVNGPDPAVASNFAAHRVAESSDEQPVCCDSVCKVRL
jgi:hypothetical protein